jgi:hypothetical protein
MTSCPAPSRRRQADPARAVCCRLRPKIKSSKTNGFVERFNGTALDQFFRVKMRETFYETVEGLQADCCDPRPSSTRSQSPAVSMALAPVAEAGVVRTPTADR